MRMSKSVQEQLDKILAEFLNKESDVIEKAFSDAGKAAKEQVKANSPRRKGDYAEGWRIKKSKKGNAGKIVGNCSVIVYNKDHYRLTHLLEHGHIVRNQYGAPTRATAKRRVMGQPHIADAQKHGEEILLHELERNL